MEKDKKNRNEYPKLSSEDQRWKQQDEFDASGPRLELEDQEKNATIEESTKDINPQGSDTNNENKASQSQQKSGRDRDQP